MRICLIAEGSYPYIVGGVSSWIQTLITELPEHQFFIYAIGAYEKDIGKFKYKLPANVVGIKEVFFDTGLKQEGRWGKKYRLTKSERKALELLLLGEIKDWREVFHFFLYRCEKVADFLMSWDFFDVLQAVYQSKYSKTPFTSFFWTVRSMYLNLFYLLRQGMGEADLYHSVSTGYAGIMGSLGKHLHGKPFIITEHGIYTREREEEIIKADWVEGHFKDVWIDYFYNLSRCAYNHADRVVTLFQSNQDIQLEVGCPPDKTQIIPNGVEIADFADLSGKDPDDTYINIGAIVRVVPIKDIKSMLQSFAIVKKDIPQAKFYIIGPTDENEEYYQECWQLLKSLETEDVVFTGRVNIKEFIGKMDLLVLSSISEGQPLAMLEGMASKKPFVATNVGSCKELLYGKDDVFGQAGIIVAVMNYERMAEAMIELCKNEKLRQEMSRAAFSRVSNFYSKTVFIAHYRELYASFQDRITGT